MSRNGSGTYVLPEPAFVPNTAISSSAVNSDFSDIADALTDSLARDGQGGMTAVLPLANTGFTYLSDPNTGIRRTGADTQAIQCGGADVVTATPTGISVAGTLAVSGALTVGGSPLLLIGEMKIWPGLTAPSKWVFANGGALLRASYPDLWTFASAEIAGGNTLFTNGNGTTTFTVPDLSGRVPAGREAVAARLTSTYFGGNSTILGATGQSNENNTLVTANLPAYTPSGTITNGAITFPNVSNTSVASGAGGAMTTGPFNAFSNLTAQLSPVQASSIFNGSAQGGTSAPFRTVQPTIIVNYIIYAGA